MKEIKAFIRPNKVNEIVQQLKGKGVENITISMAEGTGKLQDENAFVSRKFLYQTVRLLNLKWR